ncbi:hypothetical protein [Halanaerobacter jeridensis]|uniref:Opacity protein-like surface antigen n=1 Tax=Halanaerobacter jeridensis TaxID=706427 RepID=A0A938XTD9_9FIRM|nr:hypothetical protein [Halanaerobacter jeridensis]MBM7555197.1 opacity protein-like surface antigen [Halanaerobacter jeridensis]
MKLKLVIVLIILSLFIPDLAGAQTKDKLEFEFWQMQYQLKDIVETREDVREIAGELGLESNIAMKLNYRFWDGTEAGNNQLENFTLDAVKDFAASEDEKLALGLGVDYYQQTIESERIDLSQLDKKSLQLVVDVEKELMDRVNLFTKFKYGLYNDYQFFNKNLESDISYDSNYSYSIKSGLSFKVGSGLNAKLGYKFSQESLERSNSGNTIINGYDLSLFNQLQYGLFLGLETKF